MDSFEALLLVAGAAVIALVTIVVVFKPFDRVRRGRDGHESGAWAWVGGNHRNDGDCAHDGGGGGGD